MPSHDGGTSSKNKDTLNDLLGKYKELVKHSLKVSLAVQVTAFQRFTWDSKLVHRKINGISGAPQTTRNFIVVLAY